MKQAIIIISLLVLAALASALMLVHSINNQSTALAMVPASVQLEAEAVELVPCDVSNETVSNVSEETVQNQTTVFFQGTVSPQILESCDRSTHDYAYHCGAKPPAQGDVTRDQYRSCQRVSCGGEDQYLPAGVDTTRYSYTERMCECLPVERCCIYGLTGYDRTLTKIRWVGISGSAGEGVKCKPNAVENLPASCSSFGQITLKNVTGNYVNCALLSAKAGGSCSTSGSISCSEGWNHAKPCTPNVADPIISDTCRNDILNQGLANGNCWYE